MLSSTKPQTTWATYTKTRQSSTSQPFSISTLLSDHSMQQDVCLSLFKESKDVILSFIELRGFIQVGKDNSHEMVIGVPKNFPQGPPIFLMSVNRSLFMINREQQMLMNKEITLQKDQNGFDFIKLNFPFLTVGWKPMTSLVQVYTQLKTVINSPPLLIEIQSLRSTQNNQQNKAQLIGSNKNNSNKNLFQSTGSSFNPTSITELTDNKSIQLSNSLSTLQELQEQKDKLQYLKSRNEYLLKDHLKQLQTKLSNKSKLIHLQTQEMTKIRQKCQQKCSFDDLLAITQKDKKKLEQMAQRQALKQAEKKVKETLQKELQHGKKYSDYKKLVRSLFAQMYDNNTKILQFSQ